MITRNLSTPALRRWWASAERTAREVATWPEWKRVGVNASQLRETPRPVVKKEKK